MICIVSSSLEKWCRPYTIFSDLRSLSTNDKFSQNGNVWGGYHMKAIWAVFGVAFFFLIFFSLFFLFLVGFFVCLCLIIQVIVTYYK